MKLHIISEQVGLEGYWITDILDGIAKESLKKNIAIVDYDGSPIELSSEAPRPIVLAIGYSMHWMQQTCEELKQNNFIHEFDSGIILIMHWKAHNYIQKDRYRPSVHTAEKNQVEIVYGSSYVLK